MRGGDVGGGVWRLWNRTRLERGGEAIAYSLNLTIIR
jgi:hypothetical protein